MSSRISTMQTTQSPYAGLEHRGAFPPQAGTAAGMRVTEVRKAGWHIIRRPERKAYDALDRTVETVLPGVNEKGNKRVQKVRYGITDDGLSYTETTLPALLFAPSYAPYSYSISPPLGYSIFTTRLKPS